MKTKIILFENQLLYLENLICLLERTDLHKTYEILPIQNFSKVEQNILEPGTVLFLNVGGLPTVDATDHIEKLLEINPYLKIIVHSHFPEAKMIKRFFDKGIKSYLGNNATSEEFLDALAQVVAGNIYINTESQNILLNFLCQSNDYSENKVIQEELTAREKDVLKLVCEGLRSKEIAEKLFISTHTVESHRRNMMSKFNLNTSSKLVQFAFRNNLVEY